MATTSNNQAAEEKPINGYVNFVAHRAKGALRNVEMHLLTRTQVDVECP